MSQDVSVGVIAKLSESVGTNEPALRLLLTVLAGYPLALVHRKFVYNKPPAVQHLFSIICGFLLGFWNYGWDIFHTVFAITVTYAVLLVVGGTALSVALVFIFNMTYLLLGYYYMGTDTYDINWTMPQCILVLRLIGIGFDLYDGHRPPETLSGENKKVALERCPTVLEFFGHTLFPASFMVGPQFPMKRYQDFVAGKFGEGGEAPDSVKAAVTRFGLGLLYLGIFQVLGLVVSDEYIYSEEFGQLGFFRKMVLMGIWGRFTLYKYISCWLLTEGACILFGSLSVPFDLTRLDGVGFRVGAQRQRRERGGALDRSRKREVVHFREHHRVHPLHPVLQHQHQPVVGAVHLQKAQIPRQPPRQPIRDSAVLGRLARVPLGLLRLLLLRVHGGLHGARRE
jgi:lysophospholipid acyltransferase 5